MIVIDSSTATPPFEQIRLQFREQIHSGGLLAGTRLPTVRRLAADLNLATNTVARAYRELEAAGLIVTRGRGGTLVAANGDIARQRAHAAALSFARDLKDLGITVDEALRLVTAAYA